MSNYKNNQVQCQNYNQQCSFGSSSLDGDFFENDSDIDIPHFVDIMQNECENFIESVQNYDYDSANEKISIFISFFSGNHNKLNSNKVDIFNFIQAIDETGIFPFILLSFDLLIRNDELFNNIIKFITEFSNGNVLFRSYLADTFLLKFVVFLNQIFSLDIYKQNIKNILIILSNLLEQTNPQSIDLDILIPNINSIIESLLYCNQKPQCEIIIFLSNVIKKIEMNVQVYQLFIKLLNHPNSLNDKTFVHAINALHVMIKNKDEFIINYILLARVLEKFSTAYFANEYLLETPKSSRENYQTFPIFLKTLTEVLKFYYVDNPLSIQQPEHWKKLLSLRESLLKQFPYKFLLSKFDSLDNKSSKSCHSIIDFIFVLLQQKCLMAVFKDQQKLIHMILLIYHDIDEKGREKILQLFPHLMNYSKFFRNQILQCDSIDFSDTFTDFIESKDHKSICLILDIIDLSLSYYYKKGQESILLENLYSSEDFMESLFQVSREILDEDISEGMNSIWNELDKIAKAKT